jgi:plastocyanin
VVVGAARKEPRRSSVELIVRVRTGLLAAAVVLGAAAAAVPSLAAGNSASFSAVDFAWTANGNAKSTSVTIAPGGSVGFSYPTGRSLHNADFGNGPRPAGCAQTAGAPAGRVPPLPHIPSSAGWSGSCSFVTPGIYRFHCDEHPFMTGAVVVQGPPGSPLAGRPATAISIPSRQRGVAVHGTVKLSRPAAGGTLEVDLRVGTKQVGRLTRTPLSAGTLRFAAAIGPASKRALRSRGRLTVTAKVIVRPPGRPTVSVTRRLQLSST